MTASISAGGRRSHASLGPPSIAQQGDRDLFHDAGFVEAAAEDHYAYQCDDGIARQTGEQNVRVEQRANPGQENE
jgi:hypothetical protein